jgi:hypothetical protein
VLVSAELRWFWKGALPDGLDAWFRSGSFSPGVEAPRSDEYVVDTRQTELGLKKRGVSRGVEIKGLIAVRGRAMPPFDGCVQIWGKWSSETLSIDHLPRRVVHKSRWLRKYDSSGPRLVEVGLDPEERSRHRMDRPDRGCQLELVAVRLDDDATTWWSLGFEAFGELDTVEDSLRRTVADVGPTAPRFARGLELSYPAWLAAHAGPSH